MKPGTSLFLTAVLSVALVAITAPPATSADRFSAHVLRVSHELKRRMTGRSWHRGCPVPIRRLRLVRVSFHGFDGHRHIGKMVAHKDAVKTLVRTLRAMYRKGFKIHRMRLVDHYGGSDKRSMQADNTSAFNCRRVAGSKSWSEHAYGRAIDINPVENPFVSSDGTVDPPRGRRYANRRRHAKGMIHAHGVAVRTFARAGWGWGGNWHSAKDYQHFSASGR